jgi:DNA-binding transcriptional LysR family regulator
MSFQQINLNDLLALEALLVECHITRAAQRCGISQSAMSHALKRLRTTLGDPLLVRGQSGFVLTPRATRLAVVVTRALAELQHAMFVAPPFEPTTSKRVFRVACVDLVVIPMLVPLMRRLEHEAPGVSVVVQPLEPQRFLQQLEDDEIDLVILGPESTPGMSRSHLYDERLVCVLHADHPAVHEPWTRERFGALRHAMIAPHEGVMTELERMLAAHGLDLYVVLRVPYFVAGTMAAALCKLALMVSHSMASSLAELMPIVVRELPFELPSLPIWQVWHPKNDGDAAIQWFRDAVARSFRGADVRDGADGADVRDGADATDGADAADAGPALSERALAHPGS